MDEVEKKTRERAAQIVEEFSSTVQQIPQQPLSPMNPQRTNFEEEAKNFVGARATAIAMESEDVQKGVTDRKKAELLNHADAHLKQEEAENKKADTLLQQANYGVYEGVATYAGIKKPLPHKMQNILFAILSAVQTILLIAFGIPISLINIIADGIDSIVKKLGNITRSARWIVLIALAAGVGWLVFVIVKYFLIKSGII